MCCKEISYYNLSGTVTISDTIFGVDTAAVAAIASGDLLARLPATHRTGRRIDVVNTAALRTALLVVLGLPRGVIVTAGFEELVEHVVARTAGC